MTSASGPRLEWAIKPSFVAYVEALPDGGVELEDGVTRTEEGAFVFPGVVGTDLAFRGAVRFHGHAGVLDVTIADPRVEPTGSTADLTIALGNGNGRVRFATVGVLTRTAVGILSSADVSATDDGAYVLGGVYQAGTALDPFTVFTPVAA